jgi:CheY-like chemotaxis protein
LSIDLQITNHTMHTRNVLVVEDDDTIRHLLVEYLSQRATRCVDSARDGVEALHRVMTKRYGVIVLDMLMPRMSGTDLLDSLKAMASDPSFHGLEEIPTVIVVTSAAESDLPSAAIEQRFPALVSQVFRKPFDVTLLARSVGRVIGDQ